MFVLAHLSDPHIGPIPTPRLAEVMNKRSLGLINWYRKRHRHHRADVLDAIVRDMQRQAPGHIALAGDLVNISLATEFVRAARWLEQVGTPQQVTLVPDAEGQLTSDHGWDTIKHKDYLKEIIAVFKKAGIRVSVFIDPVIEMVEGAVATGTDRVELYTEGYARQYHQNREDAIRPYIIAARRANELGLGINAGHDLDLDNLQYFAKQIPGLLEVSIGHALISDALYLGYENAIQLYKRQLG